jgi:hypothetical protein
MDHPGSAPSSTSLTPSKRTHNPATADPIYNTSVKKSKSAISLAAESLCALRGDTVMASEEDREDDRKGKEKLKSGRRWSDSHISSIPLDRRPQH